MKSACRLAGSWRVRLLRHLTPVELEERAISLSDTLYKSCRGRRNGSLRELCLAHMTSLTFVVARPPDELTSRYEPKDRGARGGVWNTGSQDSSVLKSEKG